MNTSIIDLILVGDSGVGKTCFIEKGIGGTCRQCFTENGVGQTCFTEKHKLSKFMKEYTPTVSVTTTSFLFYGKKYSVPFRIHEVGNIELIDTVNAKCCIIMFSTTDKQSYDNIDAWYEKIKEVYEGNEYKEYKIPIVLCGNKVDVENRVVKLKQINFHRDKDIEYYDISGKSLYNIDKPFISLISKMLE